MHNKNGKKDLFSYSTYVNEKACRIFSKRQKGTRFKCVLQPLFSCRRPSSLPPTKCRDFRFAPT